MAPEHGQWRIRANMPRFSFRVAASTTFVATKTSTGRFNHSPAPRRPRIREPNWRASFTSSGLNHLLLQRDLRILSMVHWHDAAGNYTDDRYAQIDLTGWRKTMILMLKRVGQTLAVVSYGASDVQN
jgi:hypothetical protein